ncbi:hypothetical protein GCM10011411_11830 [Aurantiacibacter arachoides]|nr:hypothetical protein GCM10011411_11830 [Aurantiacibacter arachoides]
MMAIAVSLFFGLVAAYAIYSAYVSVRYGVEQFRVIRAELGAGSLAGHKTTALLRRSREASTRAVAS